MHIGRQKSKSSNYNFFAHIQINYYLWVLCTDQTSVHILYQFTCAQSLLNIISCSDTVRRQSPHLWTSVLVWSYPAELACWQTPVSGPSYTRWTWPCKWIDFPHCPQTYLFTTDLSSALGWGCPQLIPVLCFPTRSPHCTLLHLHIFLLRWSGLDCPAWMTSMTIVVTVMRIFPVSIPVELVSPQSDWQSGISDGPCSQR